jgi:excinuclease ABC subunit C
MNLESIKRLNIPKSPGIYKFLGMRNKIIYIGKASDLRSRVFSYWRKSTTHSPMKESMLKQIKKIDWIETDSEIEALLLEANLIKKYRPEFNILMRDDKRYIYIKVSTEDEIPGVFITRKIEKSGKYFGPFTSVEPVRQTLKAIRKIWPYCTERRIKAKPCFYYQINRCIGICGGVASREKYIESVIKPIVLFLQGKKGRIIKNYELRIKNYGKELKKYDIKENKFYEIQEKMDLLKFQLINIKKVLEHAKILSVGEKYANDVVELAKVLGLPKIPERIEGYDISNIFGKEATGSMVVFRGGEPEKSEYRKFKIKINQGEANDVGMLKEVLERRFKNDWALPDLIIVDGGKAQLNVALKMLRKYKLDLPVIAISKGLPREIPRLSPWGAERISRGKGLRSAHAPDKLFFPGERKPLELPLASPALHLIKRVRDEAHRFAISYHRKLKRKKLL